MTAPSPRQRQAFYAAALVGLRALDDRERSPRRFGPDADARWAAFRGALDAGDRIDLLLRDAAVSWGAAFSPARVFDLFGLADDDPFGPDWQPLAHHQARRLLAEMAPATLDAAASALGVEALPVDLPLLTPATRWLVAGGAAVLAVAHAFAADPTLSWSDQVAVVASRPSHRQLAGLAAVLVGARSATTLVHPSADPTALSPVDAAVVSPDAEPEAAAFARRAARGA